MDWYLQQANTSQKYREYRWLLQVFQSHEPEQRLTLKAPAHTGNLEALLHHVPNAMVVQTHRDPVTCISSASNLIYTFHLAVSNEIDMRRQASLILDQYEGWLRRDLAFREAHPGVIFDVYYDFLYPTPSGQFETFMRTMTCPGLMPMHQIYRILYKRIPKINMVSTVMTLRISG